MQHRTDSRASTHLSHRPLRPVVVGSPPARLPGHGSGAIAPPSSCQVWIDFDGTITVKDVLDELILRYAADDSWLAVEELWRSGRIGSRECLEAEFGVISITKAELDSFLKQVRVDAGFTGLLSLLSAHRIPVAILSDGIDQFISTTLERHGIHDVEVRANSLDHTGRKLALRCPHANSACRSSAAHCKCSSIETLGSNSRSSIYIGDGRSDLCPARTADVVFAKGALADALLAEQRPFYRFSTLADVRDILDQAWKAERKGMHAA